MFSYIMVEPLLTLIGYLPDWNWGLYSLLFSVEVMGIIN
jgi:hypothetical protein